jgi:acylphosphatase
MVCRRFRVSGRVQAVGFRAATFDEAQSLGLTGWVRNLSSGDVEVLACGELEALTALEHWLSRGPRGARVAAVVAADAAVEVFEDFEIR